MHKVEDKVVHSRGYGTMFARHDIEADDTSIRGSEQMRDFADREAECRHEHPG